MVFCLAFYFFLLATAFAEPDTVHRNGQPTNNVKLTPESQTTIKPSLKNAQRMGYAMPGDTIQDQRCPYAGILLQLLSMLLEFLQHSSESDKVNKVVAVMKNYLQNAPLSRDKDELFMKLKVIENQLHNQGPLHDYLTRTPNGKATTTIIFKTEVPNLGQPKCKTEFSRLIQLAYNNYVNIAKYQNCQQNPFPTFDESSFPGEKVPFEITFNSPNNMPDPDPYFNTPPSFPQNTNAFPNQNTNVLNPVLPDTNSNPRNKLPNPLISKLQQLLPIVSNISPQYAGILSQYIKDHPEVLNDLFPSPKWPYDSNNELESNPNSESLPKPIDSNIFDIPSLPNYNNKPEEILPVVDPPNPFTTNNLTSLPFNYDFSNFNIPSELNQISNVKPPTNSDNLLDLLSPGAIPNPLPNKPNDEIDYSVLLGQLGLLSNRPQSNNNINQGTPSQNYPLGPGPNSNGLYPVNPTTNTQMNPLTNPFFSNINPGMNSQGNTITNPYLNNLNPGMNSQGNTITNPYLNNLNPGMNSQGNPITNPYLNNLNPGMNSQRNPITNPYLNNINEILNGNSNNNLQDTILDKKRIPIQLDRFTVNHDRIPYILEYIASMKNPGNHIGNLLNNNAWNVGGNPNQLDLSAFGVTNPAKLANKAGIIELTYVLKRPQPLVYHPVYYVKYRLPYTKFVQNYRNLILQKPVLRSEPAKIYKEIISLSNITEVSPDLKGYDKEDIINLMVNNGTLVTAKLINGKDDALNEQLELVQDLNSNSSPADINRLTNETIMKADIANENKLDDTEKLINIPDSIPGAVGEDLTNVNQGDSPNLNPLASPNPIDNFNTYMNPNNMIKNNPTIPIQNNPFAPTNADLYKDSMTNPINSSPFSDPNFYLNDLLNNPAFKTAYSNHLANNPPNKPKVDANNPFSSLTNDQIKSILPSLLSNIQKANPGYGNYQPNSRK